MTAPKPRLSVLMSVYNGARHVPAAARSILEQTFDDFEFVIVDDGSTDETAAILADLEDRRVRLLANTTNLGLPASLNRGLEVCQGEYIARMDADDLSEPERLVEQVTFLDAHPGVAAVGSAAILIDQDDEVVRTLDLPCEPEAVRRHLVERGNALVHGSVTLRAEVLRVVGGYREPFRLAQDYDLWLRLCERSDLANLAEPLYRLRERLTDSGRFVRQRAFAGLAAEFARVRGEGGVDPLDGPDAKATLERFAEVERGRLPRTFRRRALLDLAKLRIERGRRRAALAAVGRALLCGANWRDVFWLARRAVFGAKGGANDEP